MIEVSVVLITAHVIAYFMLKSDDREIEYSWRTSRKVIAFFMLRNDSMRNRAGFTLIEILAVVLILGILGAMVVPQIGNLGKLSLPRAMAANVRSDAHFNHSAGPGAGQRGLDT